MNKLITLLQLPIISGVIIPLASFAFGYFLFKSQGREEARLEVFRRRLNAYEKVSAFMEEVDIFAHNYNYPPNSSLDLTDKRNALVERCFGLVYSNRVYMPLKISNILEQELAFGIGDLPESLGIVEDTIDEINAIIDEEIGKYMNNWHSEMKDVLSHTDRDASDSGSK
jgi:hypothetical protein